MQRWLAPADALVQQAAWWVAVLGAASGRPRLAAVAGAAVVALHLALRPGERRRVAVAVAAAATFGFVTDSLLVVGGLLALGGGGASPAWMVGLWGAFGAALTASLRAPAAWPAARLAALAALAGPFAYRAGAALGAIDFPAGALPSLAAVAAQWALGAPALAWVARRAGGAGGDAAAGTGAAAPDLARGRWRWAR